MRISIKGRSYKIRRANENLKNENPLNVFLMQTHKE
jgi:hypothetical protein